MSKRRPKLLASYGAATVRDPLQLKSIWRSHHELAHDHKEPGRRPANTWKQLSPPNWSATVMKQNAQPGAKPQTTAASGDGERPSPHSDHAWPNPLRAWLIGASAAGAVLRLDNRAKNQSYSRRRATAQCQSSLPSTRGVGCNKRIQNRAHEDVLRVWRGSAFHMSSSSSRPSQKSR